MKQTILQTVALHNQVMAKRRQLLQLFKGLDVSVTIGGSYALKAQCIEFADREIHDIDFIVSGSGVSKVRFMLDCMVALGIIKSGNSNSSGGYTIGQVQGLKMEILINEDQSRVKPDCFQFEYLEDILAVKKGYIRKYIRLHKEPRQKDVEDVQKLEKYLSDIDLPW